MEWRGWILDGSGQESDPGTVCVQNSDLLEREKQQKWSRPKEKWSQPKGGFLKMAEKKAHPYPAGDGPGEIPKKVRNWAQCTCRGIGSVSFYQVIQSSRRQAFRAGLGRQTAPV